jgi:DNA-binding XRE family transcriptional regulator
MIYALEITGEDIKKFREEKGLSQSYLAKKIGVHKNTIINYEKGQVIPDSKQEQLATLISGKPEEGILRISYPEDLEFIELPFVSVPARASFVEMPDGLKGNTHETYTVIKKGNSSFERQICIEVNGDSMEPNYPSGTIVRCKQVDPNDWLYLTSGVYVVVFANSFVIKRIRDNNYHEGFLTLHSDNTDTGGKINVKTQDLSQIWKVLRIVDAPAR